MKIGVLGGTFNPVHNGHIEIANAAINSKIVDKVLFMVASNPPHKGKVDVDASHRFNMVSLICDGVKFSASDIELNKQTNYTFDTLSLLAAQNPENEYYFITGADMFLTLNKWYRGDELMKNFKFIAIDRDESFKSAQNKKLFEEISMLTDAYILKIKTSEISSTMIRNLAKENCDFSHLVPEKVAHYIRKNGLYLGGE